MNRASEWPELDFASWRETSKTLQLWTQMAGKVRVANEPWLNHGWHVPLYLTARGLGTSLIHSSCGSFDIEFDLVEHRLVVRSADRLANFELRGMSVAQFHQRFRSSLLEVGANDKFNSIPNEVIDPIPFSDDELHRSYDAEAVHRFWRALLNVDGVFKLFRTGFIGKSSPVHLFWGSFDLAVTRFSGRNAPPHPGGIPGLPDAVTREAYDHELSSAGFWPGDERFPEAAFYSYAYPQPEGFRDASIEPADAFFSEDLGEWLLPYQAVRQSDDPKAMLLRFLVTTFQAAARGGDWDTDLETSLGHAGIPRVVAH